MNITVQAQTAPLLTLSLESGRNTIPVGLGWEPHANLHGERVPVNNSSPSRSTVLKSCGAGAVGLFNVLSKGQVRPTLGEPEPMGGCFVSQDRQPITIFFAGGRITSFSPSPSRNIGKPHGGGKEGELNRAYHNTYSHPSPCFHPLYFSTFKYQRRLH